MGRFPGWLQAVLLGLMILLIGGVGALALNGQLSLNNSQSTWKLTVLHTNDVWGYIEPCA